MSTADRSAEPTKEVRVRFSAEQYRVLAGRAGMRVPEFARGLCCAVLDTCAEQPGFLELLDSMNNGE